MNKKRLLFLVITSLLFGSSIPLIVNGMLLQNFNFHFFSKDIPGVTEELIYQKTYDLLDFSLMVVSTVVIFSINFIAGRFNRGSKTEGFFINDMFLLFMASFVFLQTHFMAFSKTNTLFLIGFSEAFYLISTALGGNLTKDIVSKFKKADRRNLLFSLYNGIFLGFYSLLVFNQFGMVAGILALFIVPFGILALSLLKKEVSVKIANLPGVILLISIFFPTDLSRLLILGLFVLLFSLSILVLKKNITKPSFLSFLYPAALVFLLSYNPTFFIGNYDSVEEGFFLGWSQRLINGQVLYRDVAVYHSPISIWGNFLFSKITSASIFSQRLFFHLLEIIGTLIYFFILRKVLKSGWGVALGIVLFLSLTTTMVRNNIEIRLGLGLLPLLFLFNFFSTKRKFWLILSGAFASFSVFFSVEVGLASIVAILLSAVLFTGKGISEKSNNVFLIFAGILLVALSFVLYLISQGALLQFIEQTSFYASAFSKGYFNTPLDRSIILSVFRWHIFDQYLHASNAFFWELARFLLLGALLYLTAKWFMEKSLRIEERYIYTTAVFGVILFRAALGRSDLHHLLFVFLVGIIILAYLIERMLRYNKVAGGIFWFLLLFYFIRPPVNSVFLDQLIFKIQTYGRVIGEYKEYGFERGKGGLFEKETNVEDIDKLVETIKKDNSIEESIFVYPWMPELYFFTNRRNGTSFDTPYAFFSEAYQKQMVEELLKSNTQWVIYNSHMSFGGLSPNALPIINQHILENYETVGSFGPHKTMRRKDFQQDISP